MCILYFGNWHTYIIYNTIQVYHFLHYLLLLLLCIVLFFFCVCCVCCCLFRFLLLLLFEGRLLTSVLQEQPLRCCTDETVPSDACECLCDVFLSILCLDIFLQRKYCAGSFSLATPQDIQVFAPNRRSKDTVNFPLRSVRLLLM